jgi:hypothetical protein
MVSNSGDVFQYCDAEIALLAVFNVVYANPFHAVQLKI